MTSAVIYNSFTLAKHFSSKILISNELLGMDILIPLAILSCLSAREKFVISNKFNQINCQKLIVEVKARIFVKNLQSPVVMLKDHRRITFVTLNRFCLLSKENHPLFLTDNTTLNRTRTKLNKKIHSVF